MNIGDLLSLKGTSLLGVGKSEEAITCFDKALKLNPNETNALYNKGNVLVKLGNIDSRSVNVWVRKGNLHCYQDEYSEAVDCYDHALNIDSNLGYAWYNKGQALLRIDRSNARYCFDKAKKLGFNINSKEGELLKKV